MRCSIASTAATPASPAAWSAGTEKSTAAAPRSTARNVCPQVRAARISMLLATVRAVAMSGDLLGGGGSAVRVGHRVAGAQQLGADVPAVGERDHPERAAVAVQGVRGEP